MFQLHNRLFGWATRGKKRVAQYFGVCGPFFFQGQRKQMTLNSLCSLVLNPSQRGCGNWTLKDFSKTSRKQFMFKQNFH